MQLMSKHIAENGLNLDVIGDHAAAEWRMRDDLCSIKYLTERFAIEKSDTVKAKILFALSFYKSPDIIPVLSSAADSENENVKFQAILTSSFPEILHLPEKLKM